MKTLKSLISGEITMRNSAVRHIAVGMVYALGLTVVLLQLRSLL